MIRQPLRRKFRLIPLLPAMLALLLALSLALTACSGGDSGEGGDASGAASGEAGDASGAAEEDADADPAISFPIVMYQGADTVGGDQVELAALLGTRPIVLNFWAGLCPPCRAEMPDFQAFYDEYGGRVLLLGIDVGEFTNLGGQEEARQLLGELGVTYPAGYTEDASVIRNYRVLGMPSTVFIDGGGQVVRYWQGIINEEGLREHTEAMLAGG